MTDWLAISGVILMFLASTQSQAADSVEEFLDLPLEDLLSMKVTSVSKKKQQLNEVASAVYVITREDILRSGVTSIPEALRMAPGIQVSRIDASKWAISSRGFASQFTNKLLVLIDGRTVYSPSYSGVYWDAQDTLLDDVERIEVIRGPGATVWGSNAVNGVINIITRNAVDTQGGLVTAGAGNEERGIASVRYGSELTDGIHGRAYLKHNLRDESYTTETNGGAGDEWHAMRGGFRIDGTHTQRDTWTFQGDVYSNREDQLLNIWKNPADPANAAYAPFYKVTNAPSSAKSTGWNLLGRWNRQLSDTTNFSLQIYYDHTRREDYFITQEHDTLDIDFQHQFKLGSRHDVIWGLGYRQLNDHFDNTFMVSFEPDRQGLNLFSAFIQDEILLSENLRLTLGSKFEHNEYTGLETQPSARMVWLPSERMTLWGAVSRAVRTPSRLEDSANIISQIVPIPPTPPVLRVYGNKDFEPEALLAYEAGWRLQAMEGLSLDLAVFYNVYDNLQTFEMLDTSTPLSDTTFGNGMSATSHGLELAVDWRPREWWRLVASYSYLEVSAALDDNSTDAAASDLVAEGASPNNQFSVRSMMDLTERVNLDLWVYRMDGLKRTSFFYAASVADYTSFNARVAWRPLTSLELSLTGHNLFDKRHPEFIGENLYIRTEVERSIYALARWDF